VKRGQRSYIFAAAAAAATVGSVKKILKNILL